MNTNLQTGIRKSLKRLKCIWYRYSVLMIAEDREKLDRQEKTDNEMIKL